MSEPFVRIESRDNAQFKALRKLAHDNTAYRSEGRIWLEGDHLCRAALQRDWQPTLAVFSEAAWARGAGTELSQGLKALVVADKLWKDLSALESPAGMGFVMSLPQDARVLPGRPTVVLDRLQDAGNVGSILRSAAAFGFGQVLAVKGTAALYGAKVLRAGMGAHFGLHLVEAATLADVQALQLPLVVTSSHRGEFLHHAALPKPCAWVLGHEGQGVSPEIEALAQVHIRIAQPGGEESLNVAAAAAICLHANAVNERGGDIQA